MKYTKYFILNNNSLKSKRERIKLENQTQEKHTKHIWNIYSPTQ